MDIQLNQIHVQNGSQMVMDCGQTQDGSKKLNFLK